MAVIQYIQIKEQRKIKKDFFKKKIKTQIRGCNIFHTNTSYIEIFI